MKSIPLLILALQIIALTSAKASSPNILLITADDLGWDSLGCTGNTLEGISPNLDRLAAQGMLIDHCHITTPICGPSRESLYSGQYPQTNGYMGHGVQPPKWWKNQNSGAKKSSITTALNNAGYMTGLVGKHGSTGCRFTEPAHGKNEETGMGRNPQKYFDYVRQFLAKAKSQNKPFFLAANAHDPHRYWAGHPDESERWVKAMMGDAKWTPLSNGKPYPDPSTQFNPDQCPIPPSYPKEAALRKPLSHYYGSVNRMDQVVGEVIKALDESGLAKDTLVIFLSDHGLAWEMSKWSLYPAGTRTPVIIRWPGKVPGKQRDAISVLSAVDIAPTIAEACGVSLNDNIDGKSFLNLILGKKESWKRREAFACFNYMNNGPDEEAEYPNDLYKKIDQYRPSRALSSNRFTYIWNGWSDGSTTTPPSMGNEVASLLKASHKAHIEFMKKRTTEELYDTQSDPGCLTNLAKDANYRDRLYRFRGKMETVLENTQDHELDNYRNFIND